MRARYRLIALVSGLLFGTGLALSGMTNPANIFAFLDVAGSWNPALAVVMASAIVVAAPAFWLVKKRHRTLLGEPAEIANGRPVDASLVLGSAIFGAGWGLTGICPGPGLLLAASGKGAALLFVAAMSAGMVLGPRLRRPGRTNDRGPAVADDDIEELSQGAKP